MGAICGSSRGRYGKPISFKNLGIKSFNEIPDKLACEHDDHWKLGKGTRNGQTLYYPVIEMFIQKWEFSEIELKDAVDNYDMFSLEMKTRIICKKCADYESLNFKI